MYAQQASTGTKEALLHEIVHCDSAMHDHSRFILSSAATAAAAVTGAGSWWLPSSRRAKCGSLVPVVSYKANGGDAYRPSETTTSVTPCATKRLCRLDSHCFEDWVEDLTRTIPHGTVRI